MRVKEVKQYSDKTLREEFESNDTGLKTDDLIAIYRTHQFNNWHPASFDEIMEDLDTLEAHNEKTRI